MRSGTTPSLCVLPSSSTSLSCALPSLSPPSLPPSRSPLTRALAHPATQGTYLVVAVLHALEALAPPPAHLPDLFPVLNLCACAGVFGLAWLWAGKRLVQEAWALGGVPLGSGTSGLGLGVAEGAGGARERRGEREREREKER